MGLVGVEKWRVGWERDWTVDVGVCVWGGRGGCYLVYLLKWLLAYHLETPLGDNLYYLAYPLVSSSSVENIWK